MNDQETAAMRRRVDALEKEVQTLRKAVHELQRQSRTPGIDRGVSEIEPPTGEPGRRPE